MPARSTPSDALPPLSTDPPPPGGGEGDALAQRLQIQTIGRLVVASLLLGGTLLLAARDSSYSSFTPSLLIGLITATYAVAGLAAMATQAGRELRTVARAQIGWDILLTTGLVYVSGAAGSVFTILYGVAVLNAAIVLGARDSSRVAAACGFIYLVLGVSVSSGWLPHAPDQATRQYSLAPAELGFSILSNVVGLGVVAALAANLASRLHRAGGRLRQAEAQTARLAQLQDDIVRSISAGLITTDLEGRIRTLNPAAERMLEAEGLVGSPLQAILPIAPEQVLGRGETDAARPDGSTFPVGYTATPLLGAEGERGGTLIVFQDLTEIRMLQEQAQRAERLAALGRLAGGLAHEIRNPLGAISGSVQMVRDMADLQVEDRRLLTIVLEEVERLNELVTTMLDVGGRQSTPRPDDVDLHVLLSEVVEMARGDTTLGGRGHRGAGRGRRARRGRSRPSTTGRLESAEERQSKRATREGWSCSRCGWRPNTPSSRCGMKARASRRHNALASSRCSIRAGTRASDWASRWSRQIVDAHGGRWRSRARRGAARPSRCTSLATPHCSTPQPT